MVGVPVPLSSVPVTLNKNLKSRMVLGVPVPLSNSANDVMLHQCSDDTRASLILHQLLQIPTLPSQQPQAGVNPSNPARLPRSISEPFQGYPLAVPSGKGLLGLTRPYPAWCRQFQAPVQGQLASSTYFSALVMAGTSHGVPAAPVKPS